MEAFPPIVVTLLGAISILATAIAAMYRERLRAADNEVSRLVKANTDDATRYEARIAKLEADVEERDDRIALQNTRVLEEQKDLAKYWGNMSEVINRANEGMARRR